MNYQDYTQKVLDNDALQKQQQADWIAGFRQTDTYRQLLEEFEPESVENNLEHLARQRAQIYKVGSYRLKEEQEKRASLVPFALRFFRAVQVKKLFDMEVNWNAGKLDLRRMRRTADFKYFREMAWGLTDLPPVDENDLAFIRSLLSDDEYLEATTEADEGYFRPEDQVAAWYESWDPAVPVGEDYPVFFRKYDAWNLQQWVPDLPPVRFLSMRKQEMEELAATWTDPDEGKINIPWGEVTALTEKWFGEKEPVEMQRWFDAYAEIMDRKIASHSLEFLNAIEFLLDQPVRPYPNGTLRWDLSLVATARKIRFGQVASCLDLAFETYTTGLENNSCPLDHLEEDF